MHVVNNCYCTEQQINEKKSCKKIEEFDFKFISKSDFNSIYKRVQRRRRNEIEKKRWEIFIKKKTEEENKQEKRSRIRSYVSPEQCPSCMENIHRLVPVHINEKPNCLPIISSYNADETQESSRKTFSLHVPLPRNENNSNIILDNNNLDKVTLEYDYKKVEALRTKMDLSLRNIYQLMIRGPDISEQEDIERIKLRSIEFSNRFKRNYLYRVQCNINEIDKRINEKQSLLQKEILAQKIILAHQSCLQTLQVIEKHLPKISINSPFTVFNDFFMCICDLTKKFKLIFGLPPKKIIDDIVALSEHVMDAMIDLLKIKSNPKKLSKERKKPKDNLWMYSNKYSWHGKASTLAKLKFGQKNQKTIQNKIKDAQDVINSTAKTMQLPIKSNSDMSIKKSKLNLRKRGEQIAEDEIETMVQKTYLNENDIADLIENLQIDLNPISEELVDTWYQEIEQERIFPRQDITPQTSARAETVSLYSYHPPSYRTTNTPLQKNVGDVARNVALICVKKESTEELNKDEVENKSLVTQENEEKKYRKLFRKYKENSGHYNDKILGITSRMSSVILDDTVDSIVDELKCSHI